jgi:hypothetical protein
LLKTDGLAVSSVFPAVWPLLFDGDIVPSGLLLLLRSLFLRAGIFFLLLVLVLLLLSAIRLRGGRLPSGCSWLMDGTGRHRLRGRGGAAA